VPLTQVRTRDPAVVLQVVLVLALAMAAAVGYAQMMRSDHDMATGGGASMVMPADSMADRANGSSPSRPAASPPHRAAVWDDPGALAFFSGSWVLMVVAMMFPSALPFVAVQARIASGRAERAGRRARWAPLTALTGYVLVWTAFGLLLYAFAEGLQRVGDPALVSSDARRFGTAAILLCAAAYEMTALKDVCLRRCRDPFSLALRLGPGRERGGIALGVRYGAWCVGCCAMLMLVLFAAGTMSVAWMLLIAAIIAAEKLSRSGLVPAHAVAMLLAGLAGLAIAVPSTVGA
jgi:predicted metal-binding membrane protein